MAAIEPFSGEQSLPFPPDRVYAALRELEGVAKQMPDVQSVERVDDHTLKLVVRPGFSFLRGTLKVTMQVEEREPGRTLVQTATSQGIGMSMTIRSEISISPAEGGTCAAWRAEVVERKGLVSAVGPSLIKAAANKVLEDGWTALRAALSAA
jgi:carbon monoxide dehydrogenase subunit G